MQVDLKGEFYDKIGEAPLQALLELLSAVNVVCDEGSRSGGCYGGSKDVGVGSKLFVSVWGRKTGRTVDDGGEGFEIGVE